MYFNYSLIYYIRPLMGLTEIYAASCCYYYKIVTQIGLSPKLLSKTFLQSHTILKATV